MTIKEARPTDEQKISATMTSKGQVTVPKAVRDQLGLEAGKKLDFILRDGEVLLRPQRPRRRSFFEAIGTLTPPDGMTAEEYVADLRYDPGDREILHSMGTDKQKVTYIEDFLKPE
ncbi:AbrB/MazE/SpoVT family DNA-binding domain-containing protein [Deinococcus frigens]|uniref:AbrB/MazE/SpoVT family DNA-binding domain-containing protein n=1 Tax=Deinococcus frigens TaxID=249403 RepID=UPI00068B3FC7|nr:AbrB/MazE/SpoVT family DNA-binding domain-containing protein [Deinococcus frigens]